MPANFTRRLDLFGDAGFADPQAAVAQLSALAEPLQIARQGGESGDLDRAVAALRLRWPLSSELIRLVRLAPEWLFARGGDLATVLWLVAQQHARLDVAGFAVALADELLRGGRGADAFCLLRFLTDVEFDFGRLHGEKGPAYGFFQEREPNPLVWKLLEYFDERATSLRVLELGAGIGNDALGFLTSPRVASLVGVDLSEAGLKRLVERAGDARVRTLAGDFARVLKAPAQHQLEAVNLVYSYSSLHYFSSGELSEILTDAHRLLVSTNGHLAFAIKGAGSVWAGQGVPLYRPDVWINHDGQSRWFPSVAALDDLLEAHHFALKFHEIHDHWGYSERGKRDLFHYVLCAAV